MEKRLKEYIASLEELTNSPALASTPRLCKNVLTQIEFFQHERLIHLLVTIAFAFFALLSMFFYLLTEQFMVLVLFFLFLVLLIPYIRHYYILENGTQKLYALYDILLEKAEKQP